MFRGLIHRHARCILIDPYANAFQRDLRGTQPLSWAVTDKTDMKPGVAERKWEIDRCATPSAWPRLLASDRRYRAIRRGMARGDGPHRQNLPRATTAWSTWPLSIQRATEDSIDTLAGDGYGAPTRPVGMIHSMFRPSDDACVYPS